MQQITKFIEKIKTEFIGDKNWYLKIEEVDKEGSCNIYIITDTFNMIIIDIKSTINHDMIDIFELTNTISEESEKVDTTDALKFSFIRELNMRVGKISISKFHDISIDIPMKKIYGPYNEAFGIDELVKILKNFESFLQFYKYLKIK